MGKDHLGNPLTLGEFRGKVVVLTFSGNWCGPCVGMYPQERALAARHAGKPFALVSVNTDDKVETLRTSIAAGEITWRCWWDGGTTGPITTRWGVQSFPSIFVLDPAGVIRFKDVRGDDLERAVTDAPERGGKRSSGTVEIETASDARLDFSRGPVMVLGIPIWHGSRPFRIPVPGKGCAAAAVRLRG